MRLEQYINDGKVIASVPLEKLLPIASEYQEIRDERNISSHAKSKVSGFTFEQLKDKMTLALAHLRDVMNLHGDLVQNNGGDA
ncbi:MAG: hypothetical protein MR700_08855 [Selenomonadaceae bacterium]|nr:hypothetical protein [Selenomonadaceae bacterium]MCI6098890.1 hypothetical protein [Selenomonadaceae bacterium]